MREATLMARVSATGRDCLVRVIELTERAAIVQYVHPSDGEPVPFSVRLDTIRSVREAYTEPPPETVMYGYPLYGTVDRVGVPAQLHRELVIGYRIRYGRTEYLSASGTPLGYVENLSPSPDLTWQESETNETRKRQWREKEEAKRPAG